MSTYIGIDPGIHGAIAILSPRGIVLGLHDLPTVQVGRRNELDLPRLISYLHPYRPGDQVTIERVQTHGKAGAMTSFQFGRSYGQVEGVVSGLGLHLVHVTPKVWQRTMLEGYSKDGKDTSRIVAIELFPDAKDRLSKKKDHNKADALLIAEWGRRRARKGES